MPTLRSFQSWGRGQTTTGGPGAVGAQDERELTLLTVFGKSWASCQEAILGLPEDLGKCMSGTRSPVVPSHHHHGGV